MTTDPRTFPTICPSLHYRDAAAAIDWLCRAFGFERHQVVPGANGAIVHAELTFGHGMIMLGSAGGEYSDLQKTPRQVGGAGTVCICVIVADADLHHQRAVAAGAEVVTELETKSYGGRGYGCRDLEGHLWHFSTYNPWTAPR
jgi:uncharacterized glyoxalase superfamily protein PhnB